MIPVKDEEAHILKTLTSFAHQVDLFGAPLNPDQFEILILANNCSDNSVSSIHSFKRKHPTLNIHVEEITLPAEKANIGYARRLLMDTAYNRLFAGGGGIMMTTDGDTRVAPDWIAQTEAEIAAGADAVGGRILLCPDEMSDLDSATYSHHFKDETYQLLIAELESKIIRNPHNPAPTHHQHFNGGFAVTTKCYSLAGGIPHVAYLEDCAFFERLQRIDAKVRHSNKVVVHTSARYLGRTEVGLSYQLNEWKNLATGGADSLVESGTSIVERLVIKRKLMDLWKTRKDLNLYEAVSQISSDIKIDNAACESFNNSPFFGTWYAQMIKPQEGNWRKKHPLVSIDNAILELQVAIATYSVPDFSQTSIR